MALTKAWLKEVLSKAGVSAENMTEALNSILEGHVTSINALREEIDMYKADAQKLPEVQKELDALKAVSNGEWETKYQTEHKAFENFKSKIAAEKELATKKQLYTRLLKAQNVDEKRFDPILRVTNFDSMTIKDGELVDADKLIEGIKNEWAGFIVSEHVGGAHVDTPLNNADKMTRADFEKMPLSKQMEFANAHSDVVTAMYKE